MKTLKTQEHRTASKKKKNDIEYYSKEYTEDNVLNYIPSSTTYVISPTKKQARILNDNLAAVRKIWNVCNHDIKKNNVPLNKVNEVELRDKYIIKKNMSEENQRRLNWTFRTQKRIREYAIKDFCSSIKGGLTKLKTKQIKRFVLGYKSKYDDKQNMSLCHENSYIKNNKLHVYGMDILIKETVDDIPEIKHNMRLVKHGLTYYLHIPEFVPFKYKEEQEADRIVSVDLGTNIFGTYITPDFEWGEIGLGFKDKLYNKYRKEDGIKKRKIPDNKKRKAIKKNKEKIYNLVDDFQWKTAHWLLKSFKEILVSRLYVRKASGILKKSLNDSNHCRFVDRLNYLSMFYKGRIVHTGKEHYTSMHCTSCGSLNTIKGDTVMCNECKHEIHRDLAGCRNFLLKYLV